MKSILKCWYYLLLIYTTSSLTGCVHVYYSPNAHNVPLFKKKGDLSLGVAAGGGIEEVDAGVDVQTAYALTNHLGVMGNYYWAGGKEGGEYPEGGHGHLLEFGLGYYTPLFNKNYGFELYGGTGGGKVYNYYDEFKESTSNLNFNRHFVQAAFGWQSDYCKIVLSHRFGLLNYNKIQFKEYNGIQNVAGLNGVIRNKNYILNEPAFTVHFGYRAVKAQLQIVYSINEAEAEFYKENVNLNLGLYLTLPTLKKARQ